MKKIDVVGTYAATIGEGPMWSAAAQALYSLDTAQKKLVRYTPQDGLTKVQDLRYRPSCIVLLNDSRLLVAFKKGIEVVDFDAGTSEAVQLEDMSFEHEIFNDGACDRAGRLWIGSMDRKVSAPLGSLYCFESDFRARKMASGMTVSNGVGWSPDNRTMYQVDSRPGAIYAYDFDLAAGAVGNRRVFLDYAGKGRRPDGCTVDAEGHLWVAEIEGSRLGRYAPDGRQSDEIMLPVSKPTSVMFGGKDLSTLFVTSMRFGLSEEALQAQPEAGRLIAIDAGVRGVAEPVFKGL